MERHLSRPYVTRNPYEHFRAPPTHERKIRLFPTPYSPTPYSLESVLWPERQGLCCELFHEVAVVGDEQYPAGEVSQRLE